MTPRPLRLAALGLLGAAAPAFAVGLGPLSKEGVTYGPEKAFYLTLMNPYPSARKFRAEAFDLAGNPLDRIEIRPAVTTLPAKAQRRIVVIVHGMEPEETVDFRICAALAEPIERTVHARVCSKLAARRVAPARR